MKTEHKQSCPTCGQSVNPRRINLDRTLVGALAKIYRWCLEKNIHEFERKDIKHLFKSETETATFGNWVHFGGIFYKRGGRGHWGINLHRANQFLTGKIAITTCVLHDPLTGEYTAVEEGNIHSVKGIYAFMQGGDFIVQYAKQD